MERHTRWNLTLYSIVVFEFFLMAKRKKKNITPQVNENAASEVTETAVLDVPEEAETTEEELISAKAVEEETSTSRPDEKKPESKPESSDEPSTDSKELPVQEAPPAKHDSSKE